MSSPGGIPANQPGGQNAPPTTTSLKSKRTFDPTDYPAPLSDTARIQRAFAEAAAAGHANVYIPWIGRPWQLEDTVKVADPSGDYVELNLVCDPAWCLIDFKPTHGAKDAFQFHGHKRSYCRGLQMRTYGDGLRGFVWTGPPDSQGGSLYDLFRVQPIEGHGVTCFQNGTELGNDYSACVWNRCEAYWAHPDWKGNLPEYIYLLDQNNSIGHRGFVNNGPNNLYQRWDNCSAVGMKVAATQLFHTDKQEGPDGGSGTIFTNFGTTGCCLVYLFGGGMPAYVSGGRHELGGALVSHGAVAGYEQANAPLIMRDMIVDYFRPEYGYDGLFDKDALISLRSAGDALFEGIAFGQMPKSYHMYLAHNSPWRQAHVDTRYCSGHDDMMPKLVQGVWYLNGTKVLAVS